MIEMKIQIKEEFEGKTFSKIEVNIETNGKNPTHNEEHVLKEYEKRLKVDEKWQTISKNGNNELEQKVTEFLEFLEQHKSIFKDISLD